MKHTKQNLLFLDIDGVLNTDSFRERYGNDVVNPNLVTNLISIVAAVKCKIIISSDWRHGSMQTIHNALRCSRFKLDPDNIVNTFIIDNIIGETLDFGSRKDEILECVNTYEPNFWIVLDDLELELPPEHFVHTDPNVGLSCDKANEAITKHRNWSNLTRERLLRNG
jgi:hypothetical protein